MVVQESRYLTFFKYLDVASCSNKYYLTGLRLQTTIDFSIHLSYKTGRFEALYKIQKSYTTTNYHFIGTLFIIFHFNIDKNNREL